MTKSGWVGAAMIVGMIAVALAPRQAAAVGSRFDGIWSVLVVTESGTCDRGYRYRIRVDNGRLVYDGEAGIDISGEVQNNGKLNVVISRGEQSAEGSGTLSAHNGAGKWEGKSSATQCSGTWQAERRAAE